MFDIYDYMLIWVLIWALIGVLFGSSKGQAVSGLVWCLLLGPIGLVIVAILPNLKEKEAEALRLAQQQRETEEGRACFACKAAIQPSDKFCPACGASTQTGACSKCGHVLKAGSKFCASCGAAAGAA